MDSQDIDRALDVVRGRYVLKNLLAHLYENGVISLDERKAIQFEQIECETEASEEEQLRALGNIFRTAVKARVRLFMQALEDYLRADSPELQALFSKYNSRGVNAVPADRYQITSNHSSQEFNLDHFEDGNVTLTTETVGLHTHNLSPHVIVSTSDSCLANHQYVVTFGRQLYLIENYAAFSLQIGGHDILLLTQPEYESEALQCAHFDPLAQSLSQDFPDDPQSESDRVTVTSEDSGWLSLSGETVPGQSAMNFDSTAVHITCGQGQVHIHISSPPAQGASGDARRPQRHNSRYEPNKKLES